MDRGEFLHSAAPASFSILASPGAATCPLGCFCQFRLSACEQVQNRHANRYAICNLVENYAVRSVGHVRVDFHPAIHRTGVKNQNVAFRPVEAFARNSEAAGAFARCGYIPGGPAPDAECLITTMSMRIASRFLAVSTSVSPFETLEPVADTLTVSADNLFSANSKEMRVRVEFSKKRFTIVEPRNAGTFFIARSLISLNGSAVSRMSRIWSPVSDSRPSRSLPSVPVTPPTWAR